MSRAQSLKLSFVSILCAGELLPLFDDANGRFRPMRVGSHTRTHPRLEWLRKVDVLDVRENRFHCNNVLSFEAPFCFIFCKT
jgi:hypothetical protein